MTKIEHIPTITKKILQSFAAEGYKTSSSIAEKTGINQSQVYRNLYGHPKRVTKTLKKLCIYANVRIDGVDSSSLDPRVNEVLMNALALVWDGSEEHATRLAELLFAHSRASMRR